MKSNVQSLVISLAVVAGLQVGFDVRAADKPGAADPHAGHHSSKETPSAPAAASKLPTAATYRIAIVKGQAGADAPVLKARQGQQIAVVIASDQPGSVEVHGYNRNVVLVAGGEVTLMIVAKQAGQFPVHLHTPAGAHVQLTMLDVQPK